MIDSRMASDAPAASEENSRWPLKIRALLDDSQIVKTATAITCVLILLTGPREWYVAASTSALAAAALLFSGLRASHSLWLFMATAVGASALFNWEETDNHKYLLAYWCIAIASSIGESDPRAYLQRSARLLIGGCFALAVYWKIRSPDFLSGDFFRLHPLLDARFASVASWAAGVPLEQLHEFRRLWAALDGATSLHEFQGADIPVSARLNLVAVGMTWWTLFIEAWIAVAFLLPDRTRVGRLRDLPLLGFVLTTYAIATVQGFGYLLLAMALCQARGSNVKIAYLAAFFGMFLFAIPVFTLSSALSKGAP